MFNDLEDLTIRSLFPEDDETALAIIENGFTDLLLKHVDDAPSCLNELMRAKVCSNPGRIQGKPGCGSHHQRPFYNANGNLLSRFH
jgi:hypothetical protein